MINLQKILDQLNVIIYDTICIGENYVVGSSNFTSTGTYFVLLTSDQDCDSTIQVNLTVIDPIETNIQRTICSGESYQVGDSLYTTTDLHVCRV